MYCGRILFPATVCGAVVTAPTEAPAADCPVDIVFVVDESGSIGSDNFDEMQTFLSQLVARLDINSGTTRVGLVTFASDVGESFNLNQYSTVDAVQTAINGLTYTGGGTRTDLALRHVRTNMLTDAAGDRSTVPNVVVVLTDGRSNQPVPTQVK